jgi:hypothetical protein
VLGKARRFRFQDLPENAQDPWIIVRECPCVIRICVSQVLLKVRIGEVIMVCINRSRLMILVSFAIFGVGKRANGANYVQRIRTFIYALARHR